MVQRTRRRDHDLLPPTLLLISDLLAMESAFLLTFYLRFLTGWLATPLGIPPFHEYLATSFILLLVWTGIIHSQGLYDPTRRMTIEDDVVGLFRSVAIGSMVVLAMAFFVRQVSYSRTFFVIFFITAFFFLCFGRLVVRRVLRRNFRRGVGVSRVLFVGNSPMQQRLLATFERLPGLGFVAVGHLSIDGPAESSPLPWLGDVDALDQVVQEQEIDAVLLTLPFEQMSLATDLAERLGRFHVDVQFVPDMQRIHASRMRLKEIAGVPFVSLRECGLSGFDRIVKRTIDIVFSLLGLVLLAPVLVVLAILVKISSPGPILYRQPRLGRDHRSFDMLKFRTMRMDAEHESGPVWTTENDPRRTRIGTFLRRFSLDELPQLWNVLKGDMSLVGPRPEREHFVEQFHQSVPRYLERHRVRSGLTGWAQVHGLRGNTPIEVRTVYDLHYVENWSLGLDLRILIRTVLSVIRGDNAY